MLRQSKSVGPLALRLLVALALLGCPRISGAAGTWSVIPMPGGSDGPTPLVAPTAVAVDTEGNLYVADDSDPRYPTDPHYPGGRILKRDGQGNWSLVTTAGAAVGQVHHPTALAVDGSGNLYGAEADQGIYGGQSRIQRRDPQGNWSMVAAYGSAPGQVDWPTGLATDASGDLFVADGNNGRIQKRDPQGDWSVIATQDPGPSQIRNVPSLAADPVGNLYIADVPCYICNGSTRIQRRDAQGDWSTVDLDVGIGRPDAFAVDADGNLFVAVSFSWIWRRDLHGGWSVAAMDGSPSAQVSGLAVDAAGNLYVADTGNNRVQEYTATGGP